MVGIGIGIGIGLSGRRSAARVNQNLEMSHDIVFQHQILSLVDKTNEGAVVQALALPWKALYDALIQDNSLLFVFSANPEKFEEFIAASYEREGWDRVILTPRSGDGGRDVIAEKHGFGSIRVLDQCKAFSKRHLVGHSDVRAMLGVLHSDHGASKAVISTTSDFAPGNV